jgi:hypothetical protein
MNILNKIDKYINESKRLTLKSPIKNKLNKMITKIGKTYHNNIPLQTIFDILDNHDIIVLQEDLTEWSGFLTGNDAQVYFNIAPKSSFDGKKYQPYTNAMLALSYYKMTSGNYEIVAYIT